MLNYRFNVNVPLVRCKNLLFSEEITQFYKQPSQLVGQEVFGENKVTY